MGYVGDHGALCADVAARESGEKRALMSLASLQTTLGHRPLLTNLKLIDARCAGALHPPTPRQCIDVHCTNVAWPHPDYEETYTRYAATDAPLTLDSG